MKLKELLKQKESFTGWMISDINGWIGYFEICLLKYGIARDTWFESSKKTKLKNVNCDRPATPGEIKNALKKEAVKRYSGKIFISLKDKVEVKFKDVDFDFFNKLNIIYSCGYEIFNNGTWATIIKPNQMTKQGAEEKFNIEIVED